MAFWVTSLQEKLKHLRNFWARHYDPLLLSLVGNIYSAIFESVYLAKIEHFPQRWAWQPVVAKDCRKRVHTFISVSIENSCARVYTSIWIVLTRVSVKCRVFGVCVDALIISFTLVRRRYIQPTFSETVINKFVNFTSFELLQYFGTFLK